MMNIVKPECVLFATLTMKSVSFFTIIMAENTLLKPALISEFLIHNITIKLKELLPLYERLK